MIYTGSLGTISNKARWTSRVFTLVQEDDGSEVDLSNPLLTVAIQIVIRRQGYQDNLFSGTLADGTVVLNGTGFQWVIQPASLSMLCAGEYDVKVAVTINGDKQDVIIAAVSVLEGV